MQEARLAPQHVKTAASRDYKSMAKENREAFKQMIGDNEEEEEDDGYEYYSHTETERTARRTLYNQEEEEKKHEEQVIEEPESQPSQLVTEQDLMETVIQERKPTKLEMSSRDHDSNVSLRAEHLAPER